MISNKVKALLIHAVAFLLACVPFRAVAFEYDVDWTSTNSKESVLVITIDKCETKFRVKNEDLEAFQQNKQALSEAVKKSIEHSRSGCKH